MDGTCGWKREWVVELFREYLDPDNPDAMKILASLERCVNPVKRCSCGCGDPYFVDPDGPDWKFMTNVHAYKDHMLVILDIMEDFSVGAVEFQCDMPFGPDDMVPVTID